MTGQISALSPDQRTLTLYTPNYNNTNVTFIASVVYNSSNSALSYLVNPLSLAVTAGGLFILLSEDYPNTNFVLMWPNGSSASGPSALSGPPFYFFYTFLTALPSGAVIFIPNPTNNSIVAYQGIESLVPPTVITTNNSCAAGAGFLPVPSSSTSPPPSASAVPTSMPAPASGGSIVSATSLSSPPADGPSSPLSDAATGGIAVGVVGGLLLLTLGFYLAMSRSQVSSHPLAGKRAVTTDPSLPHSTEMTIEIPTSPSSTLIPQDPTSPNAVTTPSQMVPGSVLLAPLAAILGNDRLHERKWFTQNQVGLIHIPRRRSGTVFLLSPHICITARHVVKNESEAHEATVTFFPLTTEGKPLAAVSCRLRPDLLFVSSDREDGLRLNRTPPKGPLDFTVMAIDTPPMPLDAFPMDGMEQLLASPAVQLSVKPHITPVQVAGCTPISKGPVTYDAGPVVGCGTDGEGRFPMRYATSTVPSQSGAPVMHANDWVVLGIHQRFVQDEKVNEGLPYRLALRWADRLHRRQPQRTREAADWAPPEMQELGEETRRDRIAEQRRVAIAEFNRLVASQRSPEDSELSQHRQETSLSYSRRQGVVAARSVQGVIVREGQSTGRLLGSGEANLQLQGDGGSTSV